jgi:hypothetical protein
MIVLALLMCSVTAADYTMNTASKVEFYAWDTVNNVPKTGDAGQITAYVRIDGGSLTILTDTSATELSSTNAPGSYEFDVAAAETNGDHLFFSAKSSTANISLAPISVNTKAPLRAAASLVDASPAPTTTTFAATGLSSVVTDFYKGDAVVFTSGALQGQSGQIYSYAGPTTKLITLQSALTSAPVAGVTFVIVKTVSSRKLADIIAAADASGNMAAMVKGFITTAVTEAGGAGRLSAAISTWGNVATPVSTAASVNQTVMVLQSGTVATAGNARTFTLSSGFPAVANAYLPGTVLTFTDATTSQSFAGRIHSYSAGRVVTMYDNLPVVPENGDVVKVWPFFWVPVGF